MAVQVVDAIPPPPVRGPPTVESEGHARAIGPVAVGRVLVLPGTEALVHDERGGPQEVEIVAVVLDAPCRPVAVALEGVFFLLPPHGPLVGHDEGQAVALGADVADGGEILVARPAVTVGRLEVE